jgi:hypothetical protein
MKKLLFILVVILFSCEREEMVYPDVDTLDTYKENGEIWDNYITKRNVESIYYRDLRAGW